MASEKKQSFTVGGFYGAKNKRKWIGLERSIDSVVKKHKSEKIPKTFPSRILGPSLKWQTFFRQQDAFAFSRHSAKDLHVFAFESKTFVGNSGQRMYLVASYPVFWHYYSQLSPDQKHHYEVIPEGAVCKLYFDLEYNISMNPGCQGDQMVRILVEYVCRALALEFNVICTEEDVLDLDASTANKFSRHLIFQMKKAAFKDNIHAGRFVMFLMSQLVSYIQMSCPDMDHMQQNTSHEDDVDENGTQPTSNIHMSCPVLDIKHQTESQTNNRDDCETQKQHQISDNLHSEDTVVIHGEHDEGNSVVEDEDSGNHSHDTCSLHVGGVLSELETSLQKKCKHCTSQLTESDNGVSDTLATTSTDGELTHVPVVINETTKVKLKGTEANVEMEVTITKVKTGETIAAKDCLSVLEIRRYDNESDCKNDVSKQKIQETSGDIKCNNDVQLTEKRIDKENTADGSREVIDIPQRYRELLEGYKVEELKMMLVKNKNGENALYCDTGVYTKNRNFRLYQSSKLGKNNPLELSLHNKYQKHSQEQEIFYDSLIANVQYSRTLEILTFSEDTDRACHLGNIRRSKRERRDKESIDGYHKSPYPEVDEYIMSLITKEAAQGVIRHWTYFHEGELLLFEIARYRFCHNIGRQHRSNNIMYVVDLRKGVFYQKCHDPDCHGQNYKSQEWPLPRDVLPESYFDEEFEFDPVDEDMGDEELLNTTMEIERKHLQGTSCTDDNLLEDADDDDELVAAADTFESNH